MPDPDATQPSPHAEDLERALAEEREARAEVESLYRQLGEMHTQTARERDAALARERELREAAQGVVDEDHLDSGPSLMAVKALREALLAQPATGRRRSVGEEIEMPTVDYRASYLAASAELREACQRAERFEALLELAWGLIANAGNGDWSRESLGWASAAGRWRDKYHAALAADPQPVEAGGEPR